MSEVGAYTEIAPGFSEPQWELWDNYHFGNYQGRGSWGLNVSWLGGIDPPENAQVYLVWEPRVYAVWNDEEVENGESIGLEDDGLTGSGVEEDYQSPDEGN